MIFAWPSAAIPIWLFVAAFQLIHPTLANAEDKNPKDRALEPSTPAAWYGEGVRPSDARTPQEELSGFHLPEGFVIELIAAEPLISKPLNLAFDSRGRLWVTDSLEYPYQAPADRTPRDTLRVLEDSDRNGSFEKVTTFADQLNIPIGVLPYGDGALCFSIPNIWYLRDTDGDGKCDQREVVLGPFDTTRDTHGMINSLRRGEDGWIYACHGFNNQSTVAGKDGHEVVLQSGNTFRFRPDGSRIELVSQGQVNPFGMDADSRGQYYTADCHSKPITQVIRGACYPSFGRPHDGLGFAHSMMDHLHGSTAIAGLLFYEDNRFPKMFRESFFSGNVMTSRINRNSRKRQGTTEYAIEEGDFLTSDDSWFRPVDLRLGPDGAIYVADFYNKIIGHYEVPLTHPDRDRFRGRIWRIRYAPNGQPASTATLDLHVQSPESLVQSLGSDNLSLRRLAADELTDRLQQKSIPALLKGLADSNPLVRSSAMWCLYRLNSLSSESTQLLASDADPLVRLQVAKLLGEQRDASGDILLALLNDSNADTARTAAESIGLGANQRALVPLLNKLQQAQNPTGENAVDFVLQQTLRIAIRNLLRDDSVRQQLLTAWKEDNAKVSQPNPLSLQGPHAENLSSILLGLAHPDAAFLLQQYLAGSDKPSPSPEMLQHIAKWIHPEQLPDLTRWLEEQLSQQTDRQLQVLGHIESGLAARGLQPPDSLRSWASRISDQLLAPWLSDSDEVLNLVSWTADAGEPWKVQTRHCDDGTDFTQFHSSLTRGESYVGSMRSGSFTAPAQLSFWIVGHNGFPDQTDKQANRCELIDADSGSILRTAFPPRSDVARQVSWDLQDIHGRKVFIRCVDGDQANAYAWVALGRFSLDALNENDSTNRLRNGLSLIARYNVHDAQPKLLKLLDSKRLDDNAQIECLAVLAQLHERSLVQSLAEYSLQDHSSASLWSHHLRLALQAEPAEYQAWLDKELPKLIKPLSTRQQTALLRTIGARKTNLSWLIDALESGTISLAVFQDQNLRDLTTTVFASTEHSNRWKNLLTAIPQEDNIALQRWNHLVNQESPTSLDTHRGKILFQEKCSQCHQLAGQGKIVGPQLDGVGKRTRERLLEDILLPNRNVDHAFRTSTLLLEDGRILVGLIRNETDDSVALVDSEGKEQTISKQDISERKQNTQSVMPANFYELLTDDTLQDLIAYLKSQP